MVTMRRSTFTIRSTMGMMRNSPGPRAPTSRPRRKMTPRWYSGTIFTARGKRGMTSRYPRAVRIFDSQRGPVGVSGVGSVDMTSLLPVADVVAAAS
jgi:hypothetical protein